MSSSKTFDNNVSFQYIPRNMKCLMLDQYKNMIIDEGGHMKAFKIDHVTLVADLQSLFKGCFKILRLSPDHCMIVAIDNAAACAHNDVATNINKCCNGHDADDIYGFAVVVSSTLVD